MEAAFVPDFGRRTLEDRVDKGAVNRRVKGCLLLGLEPQPVPEKIGTATGGVLIDPGGGQVKFLPVEALHTLLFQRTHPVGCLAPISRASASTSGPAAARSRSASGSPRPQLR